MLPFQHSTPVKNEHRPRASPLHTTNHPKMMLSAADLFSSLRNGFPASIMRLATSKGCLIECFAPLITHADC